MHILYGCMFKVIIMNKRLKCCFIILVLVLNMVFSKQGFGEETKELKESELSAKSAVLIDGKQAECFLERIIIIKWQWQVQRK